MGCILVDNEGDILHRFRTEPLRHVGGCYLLSDEFTSIYPSANQWIELYVSKFVVVVNFLDAGGSEKHAWSPGIASAEKKPMLV